MEDRQKMLMQELRRSFLINGHMEKREPGITDPHSKENTTGKTTQGNEEKSMQPTKHILAQIKSNRRYANPLGTANEQQRALQPEHIQIQQQHSTNMRPEIFKEGQRTETPIALVQEKSHLDKAELRRHWAIHSVKDNTQPEQGHFSRDSLRRMSAKSMIKIMKGKVQDKLKSGNENEFKTYLAPEISIEEEEHRRALKNFHIFTQHNMILEKGHHFKVSAYTTYKFIINNYDAKKNEHRLWEFDYFLSNPLKVWNGQLQLRVNLNKRSSTSNTKHLPYLTVELCSVQGEVVGGAAAVPIQNLSPFLVYHKRTIVINETITFVDEPPFGQEWIRKWMQQVYCDPKDISHRLVDKDLKEDRISIQLIFEPLLPLIKFYISNDGILNWEMEHFTQKWHDEKSGVVQCQYSPYFYSSVHGYRMRVRLYLNGNGVTEGTHLAIYLDFLVGEWDDSLPPLECFPHRTTFMILDQSDLPEKKPIIVSETNKDGHPTDFFYDFANQSQIKEDLYLKNDTLQIRVIVEPIKESKLL